MKLAARIARLYAPLLPRIVLAVLIGATTTLASIGLMATSGWFITAMAAAGLTGAAINYFTPAALVRALAILRTAGRYAERLASHDATLRLSAALRARLFEGLAPLAPGALDDLRSGDLLARLKNDIDRLEMLFLRFVAPLAVALLALAVLAVLIARHDLVMALMVAATLLAVGLVVPALAARAVAPASAKVAGESAALKRAVVDDVEKLGVLAVTGAIEGHRAALIARHAALLEAEAAVARPAAVGQALAGLAGDLAFVAVIVVGVPLLRAASLEGPDLAMLALMSLATAEALMPLPGAFASLPASLASVRRLFALTDRRPTVADPTRPATAPTRPDLELSGVGLVYTGAGRPALDGVDLAIPFGRRLAVIGPSGSGKSSLADLLVRVRDPSAGSIRLGGVPLADLRLDDVRRLIALVPQKPHIFTASLGDNLRFVRPDAPDADLVAALEAAGLGPLFAALPAGLATPVGVGGSTLSGGEARRLALARALLADAPILLLDEPGEGLDPELERDVLGRLIGRAGRRTVVLFTHGTAGLSEVDEIVEIADGRVARRRILRRTAS